MPCAFLIWNPNRPELVEHDEDAIEAKLVARAEAKANRDFAAADAIRDELTAAGIVIKDGPDGTMTRALAELSRPVLD